jgi:hypothetical protein
MRQAPKKEAAEGDRRRKSARCEGLFGIAEL